jgi:circadian clock protein KaiC
MGTGIPGFDTLAHGGLPRGRATLVTGTAGSGKTIFTAQFLAAGLRNGEDGVVFVTFEDAPAEIRRNVRSFGWDIAGWEEEGRWAFVDVSPRPAEDPVVVGDFDLEALLARIVRAAERMEARRIGIDSVSALFAPFENELRLRRELLRIMQALKERGYTVVFTAERHDDYGSVSRDGLEEFIADNVVILRNALEEERRRRTVELLKVRGGSHQNGEFPFVIDGDGITVIPLSEVELTQTSSTVRITSGEPALDEMLGGGLFRDSVTLVSGGTGTGKTLMVTQFLTGGAARGERSLLIAVEESRDQLIRNAEAWGMDFTRMEDEGLLKIVNFYPHARSLEDHLVRVKGLIDTWEPHRVAVDSLSALERTGSTRSFREFVINLTASIKAREIAGLLTATSTSLAGAETITERHISTLTDTVILLRYVETYGSVRRAITVLKMRGSHHDNRVREFVIDGDGMQVGDPFANVTGVLWGAETVADPDAVPGGVSGSRASGTP